jgi:hypothetical protein
LTRDTVTCRGHGRQAPGADRLATGFADTIGTGVDTSQRCLNGLHLAPPLLVKGCKRYLYRFFLDAIRAFYIPISVHGEHGFFHAKNALHYVLPECQQLLTIRLEGARVHSHISS